MGRPIIPPQPSFFLTFMYLTMAYILGQVVCILCNGYGLIDVTETKEITKTITVTKTIYMKPTDIIVDGKVVDGVTWAKEVIDG